MAFIEREKVTEVIRNFGKGAIEDGQATLDPVDDIVLLIKAVDFIPAADVAEVNDNIDKIRKMVIHGIYSVVLENKYDTSVFVNCKAKINSLFDNYKNIRIDHSTENGGAE